MFGKKRRKMVSTTDGAAYQLGRQRHTAAICRIDAYYYDDERYVDIKMSDEQLIASGQSRGRFFSLLSRH